jgi:DNA-directed RNA polymerase subunit RPC12/RpoP
MFSANEIKTRCQRPTMQNAKRYYIRKSETDDIRGTFTLDEIRNQLRAGIATLDYEAIVGMCQTYGELKRSAGWTRVSTLLGDSSGTPPPRDKPKPPPPQDDSAAPTASFPCIACGTGVRLPLREANYRCPKCSSEYKVVRASGTPPAFLLVPVRLGAASSPSGNRTISPKVKAAFVLFGLDETATKERIREAYRESVSLYHPDKVSHLGAELRQLAEEKTKNFNAAFQALEEFYAG